MTKPREWFINQALLSVSSLNAILPELTAVEIDACLDLESQSTRRKSIVVRLIARAVKLNAAEFALKLQSKYAASL
jgi:hypothetical protein